MPWLQNLVRSSVLPSSLFSGEQLLEDLEEKDVVLAEVIANLFALQRPV